MEALNILMIGDLVPWHPKAGGGQIITYKLTEALSKLGQNITYVAKAPGEFQKEIEWGDFIYVEKERLIPQFIRALRSGTKNYDLVHLHLGNEISGFCLGYALRKVLKNNKPPKLIFSIYAPLAHGIPRSFTETCWLATCRSADAIFALSEFAKENISTAYHIPPSKIKVTYAGVDDSFFVNQKGSGLKSDNFSLVFCGRLNGKEQKGVDILLKAMPFIFNEHQATLKIIGSGPRLEDYKKLASNLGVKKNVEFPGFIAHDALPVQYSEADLFVFPSRRESFGLVIAEAMAAGLPVVSTKAGAIPEVVKDGETGILVPPDDPEKFAEAVNSFLDNPQKMKEMGEKGKERVEKYFNWDKVAERVLKYYEEIV